MGHLQIIVREHVFHHNWSTIRVQIICNHTSIKFVKCTKSEVALFDTTIHFKNISIVANCRYVLQTLYFYFCSRWFFFLGTIAHMTGFAFHKNTHVCRIVFTKNIYRKRERERERIVFQKNDRDRSG